MLVVVLVHVRLVSRVDRGMIELGAEMLPRLGSCQLGSHSARQLVFPLESCDYGSMTVVTAFNLESGGRLLPVSCVKAQVPEEVRICVEYPLDL